MLTTVLSTQNIVICDPKPFFCEKGRDCARNGCCGTYFCPTIGKDECVMNIQPPQMEGLKFFRDILDICSNNGTGWSITHNQSMSQGRPKTGGRNCDASLFKCRT